MKHLTMKEVNYISPSKTQTIYKVRQEGRPADGHNHPFTVLDTRTQHYPHLTRITDILSRGWTGLFSLLAAPVKSKQQ